MGFGPATSRAMAALAYHWKFGYSSTTSASATHFLVCRADHRLLASVAGLPTDASGYTDAGRGEYPGTTDVHEVAILGLY
jgi:hypothetical protein